MRTTNCSICLTALHGCDYFGKYTVKEPTLLFVGRVGGVDTSGVVQLSFMCWVGNEGVDIIWDTSPVSLPVTVLSHRSKFNKL